MLKSWFLRLLFGLVVLVFVMLVWRVWSLSTAYGVVADVPPGMVLGPADADLTVTMLFDYNCGYCHKAYPILLDAVKRDGRVRVALRPLAANGVDIAPRMAVAANAQGKFLEFHDALMEVGLPVNEDACREASNKLKLNWTRMRSDAQSKETTAFLTQGMEKAVALGISYTPTFVLGQIVYTPLQTMPTATDFLRLFDEARRNEAPALPAQATLPRPAQKPAP